MITCVNIGCGDCLAKEREAGMKWINLDRIPGKADVVADLENGLPFADESVDVIYASHVMEHIKKFPELMRECHRVLKPRGVLTLKVPEGKCRAAYADPTHCWTFSPETWGHFAMDAELGFDTLGMRQMGLRCKWLQVVEHDRPGLDDDKVGSYFTEIVVDYEKDGPEYEWERQLFEIEEADKQREKEDEAKSIDTGRNGKGAAADA